MDSSSEAEVSAKFYTPDKVGVLSRIAEVSLEELLMRLFAALGLCTVLIAFQRGVYNVATFFCVATRVSDSDDWPPFNGPLTETYSLRCFRRRVLPPQFAFMMPTDRHLVPSGIR